MFSGIIEDMGTVASVEALEQGRRIGVETLLGVDDMSLGESVAVSGVCLTAVAFAPGAVAMDVSAETLRCTTLGDLAAGGRVNLERSLRLNDRLGGHMVSGHVDGRGSVEAIRSEGESSIYTFAVGPELSRLTVEKGSVAVDGVSLTCFNCGDAAFDVAVIPHTAAVTTLGLLEPGDSVNIENDLLGKYVERLLEASLVK